MKTLKYISVPVLLLALFGAKLLIPLDLLEVSHNQSSPRSASGPSQAELRAKLRGKITGAARSYLSAEEADVLATRRRVAAILASARKESPIQAAYSARPFQGVKNASWAVKLGIQEKLGGGKELTQYTGRAMRPATGMLSRTQVRLMAAVAGLRDRSSARCNDFRKEVLSFADDAELELEDINVDPAVFRETAASVNRVVGKTMNAEIAIGLELALVRSTAVSIGKVMGPIIRKGAETLGVSGGLIVADGPLPIGDVIAAFVAAGGAIWTAYDIHQAVKENALLPGKIDASLRRQLDHLGRTANRAVDQIGSGYSQIYQKPL